jgi:site-specific recombinase XerD
MSAGRLTPACSNGISLPALMHLMGHTKIQTTMIYVQLTAQDVYQQYARAVAQHIRCLPAQS